jgi:23S rRNA (adenine-N6)-dimethyltransferase
LPGGRVIEADLGDVAFRAPFKVVASPPFNRTTDIVRRLLFLAPAPDAAALVLQREAAERFARPAAATSLMAGPWFDLDVCYGLRRRDFVPVPGVDVAILRIRRRATPALDDAEAEGWRAFVRFALARPPADAWRTFRPLLSRLQWRRLSRYLGLDPAVLRSELSLEHWLAIFAFVRAHAPDRKQARLSARAD